MSVQIRDAQVSDIPHLALLCMQAAGGLYHAIYEEAIPGRDTNLIVEHAFSRVDATSSFRNGRIFESDGEVVGAIHGYPADAAAGDPKDPLIRTDRMHLLTPFEQLPPSPGSYYVNAVACHKASRGRGYGRQLMLEAQSIARSLKLKKMSLHVFEDNAPALMLYKTLGYEQIGTRPVVPHPLIRYQGALLLMAKVLD